MRRRFFLGALGAAGFSSQAAARSGGLVFNEDANQFFATRANRRLRMEEVAAFIDQYADTQVRDFFVNVNAQRTGYDSKVWTPFWKGYDPKGPDMQPILASQPTAEARKMTRAWIHQAWQLHRDGIDPYAVWLAQLKKHKLGAWVSMRMNDLHNVDDEQHALHSDFWKAHPEWRRVPYRMEMRDKALDYGRKEVRDYNFALIDEIASRYDFDGLELDWMRFGYHFAPGKEADGAQLLVDFHKKVKQRLGPKKKLAVRVPPSPETARRLGLDAITWARHGLLDMVTVTNFWRTVDTDMPIATWRRLLPDNVVLCAGLELGLNAFPGSVAAEGRAWQSNSVETVRACAANYLAQGADRIYLFNYMDEQTAMDDNSDYRGFLREIGDPAAMRGKPRRHVVTYQDTWAPGEKPVSKLPVEAEPGRWFSVRQPVGPESGIYKASVRIGVRGGDATNWEVRVNGAAAKFARVETGLKPGPSTPVYRFSTSCQHDDAVVEVKPASKGQVEWMEILLEM